MNMNLSRQCSHKDSQGHTPPLAWHTSLLRGKPSFQKEMSNETHERKSNLFCPTLQMSFYVSTPKPQPRLPATITMFHSFPSLSICHRWSAFGRRRDADVATSPPSYASTFFFRQRNCIRMHLQSSVTERCKPLRLLVEGSTVSPLKALQSCVCEDESWRYGRY